MEIAALGDAVDSNEGSGVSVNVDGSKTVVSAGVTKKEEVKKDEAKKDETKRKKPRKKVLSRNRLSVVKEPRNR